MKALISSVEPVASGYRVAQVATDDMTFVVADVLFWVDCADDVVQDQFYFDPVTQQIVPIPLPPEPPPKQPQPISTGTITI
jgi:hypothetical protein